MQMIMDSKKTNKLPIETFHIGDSEEISIQKLADKMFKISGWKPQKIIVNKSPHGSVKRRLADTKKIKTMIKWIPKIKLDVGLKETLDWYRKNPKKS